jgi:hypothetical protein
MSVVKVSYKQCDYFCVPKNINLEDTNQVEWWQVAYNELTIKFVGIEEVKVIQSEGFIHKNDYECPDTEEIISVQECHWIDEEDEEVMEKFN